MRLHIRWICPKEFVTAYRDGYDDEEWREDAIDKMTVALEKCPDEDIIIAFTRLCERVEEFMA